MITNGTIHLDMPDAITVVKISKRKVTVRIEDRLFVLRVGDSVTLNVDAKLEGTG